MHHVKAVMNLRNITLILNCNDCHSKHSIATVMGDFNAHLGTYDATYTFHSSSNSNGKLMID